MGILKPAHETPENPNPVSYPSSLKVPSCPALPRSLIMSVKNFLYACAHALSVYIDLGIWQILGRGAILLYKKDEARQKLHE